MDRGIFEPQCRTKRAEARNYLEAFRFIGDAEGRKFSK